MPATPFKRKDPIVKAVRRAATGHVDQIITLLTGQAKPQLAASHRETLRLQALLHLVRRPLSGEVFNREHRVINRALKQLAPSPAAAGRKALRSLAAAKPKLDVDLAPLVDQLEPAAPPPPSTPRKKSPDPKLLRLLADLAEVRMRARYWHLPDGGFELLAPGLRLSYQRAARLAQTPDAGQDYAAALGTLDTQLQLLQRAWPLAIEPYCEALQNAQRAAARAASLRSLQPHLSDHPDLLARLDDSLAKAQKQSAALRPRLFAESAPAFIKRTQAYWDAWRS